MGDRGRQSARSQVPLGGLFLRRPVAAGAAQRLPRAVAPDDRPVAVQLAAAGFRFRLAGRCAAIRSGAGRRSSARLARTRLGALSAPLMTALSIVVPCFNEEGCLGSLHERLTAAARKTARDDYQI